jgi:hypothetical protein
VTLNFNDHLAESPDGLIATLLGHLGGKVLLGTLSLFASLFLSLLLILIGDVVVRTLLEG